MTLAERLERSGQGHLRRALDELDPEARTRLAAQLEAVDLDRLTSLIRNLVHGDDRHLHADLEPPDVVPIPRTPEELAAEHEARDAGEAMLRAGTVAAVLVAGGQGTRLGFDGPKGAFPFAPVSGRILFEHHAAKIAAIRSRYGCPLPWYIMTSPQNDSATREIFERHACFGLPPASVHIFEQGTLPSVDRVTGEILREAPDRLALSPDGHGGIFAALRRHGLLDGMRRAGVTTLFTFQVDNPLIRIARPELLGYHRLAGAEMSNVVVRKLGPEERMGVVAKSGGRTVLVEYTDLPEELERARDADGELVFWAGSIAAHAIELELAERVTAADGGLPLHRALKPVPYVDAAGRLVQPDGPNAVKFESFIFDALPLARTALSVESPRAQEFSPIKNATGSDSPQTARRDLNRLAARWLEAAGVAVPRDAEGDPAVDIEIDPRFALDQDELAARLPSGFTIGDGPVLLSEEPGNGGRTAPT